MSQVEVNKAKYPEEKKLKSKILTPGMLWLRITMMTVKLYSLDKARERKTHLHQLLMNSELLSQSSATPVKLCIPIILPPDPPAPPETTTKKYPEPPTLPPTGGCRD